MNRATILVGVERKIGRHWFRDILTFPHHPQLVRVRAYLHECSARRHWIVHKAFLEYFKNKNKTDER